MSSAITSRIKAACSCGKKYLVRAELAGKQGRCPSCEKVFRIPDSHGSDKRSSTKRCPKCSAKLLPDQNRCLACYRDTDTTEVCNSSDNLNERTEDVALKPGVRRRVSQMLGTKSLHFLIVLTVGVIAVLAISALQTQLGGEAFMGLYILILISCVVGGVAAWNSDCPKFAAVIIPLLTFEAIGLIRYAWGTAHGMRIFDNLWIMIILVPSVMLLVPVLLVMGVGKTEVPSSLHFLGNSHNDNGCGGGGCGGGGCGGGGCGGCGG